MHSIKVHAEVSAPVGHLLALVNEVDLLGSLLRFVKLEARPLAQLSRFSQLAYFRLGLFWPFEDRDFVLQARGIDLLHRNSLAIIGTSRGSQTGPPSDWYDAFPSTPYPEKPRGVTRVSSTLCGGLIRIINGHKLVVSVVMNVDPLMALVPTSLINFVTRSLACAGFSMCRKQLASFLGSEYERRVAEKPWFYDEVAGRVAEQAVPHSAAVPSAEAAPDAPPRVGAGGGFLFTELNLPNGLTVAAEQFGLLSSVFWCAVNFAETQSPDHGPHPLTNRLGEVLWVGSVSLASPAVSALAIVAQRGLALLPVSNLSRTTAFLASARAVRAAGPPSLSVTFSADAASLPAFRLRGTDDGDGTTLSVTLILDEAERALSAHTAFFLGVAHGQLEPGQLSGANMRSQAPEPAGATADEGVSVLISSASAELCSSGAHLNVLGPTAIALRGDWRAPTLVSALASAGHAPHSAGLADIARGSDGRPLDAGGSKKVVTLIAASRGMLHDQMSRAAQAAGINLGWKPFVGLPSSEAPPVHALQQCVLVCETGGDASALQWALSSIF